ncbi:MAG TPA: peptide-methionine (S)-S-oxide reductase MsrA [Saprospiraceae bacterium]|nr:peptide-methionine (S)-S-oxide reductase MsrA [Saprospiraceae bacterium]
MTKLILYTCFFVTFGACAQKSKNVTNTPIAQKEEMIATIDSNWTEKVVKSDEDWKKELTQKQYYILRQHGTERPFSSELYEVKEEGIYVCAGCKNPLFTSEAKFNSGTGWPSFFKPYGDKSLHVSADNSQGMRREALTCKRCDGHLGHVFDDGPEPTGLRYCIDGDGLLFVPKTPKSAVATFAGGCFWCTETIFESIKGVSEVISGYSGGKETNPTYESVGSGQTSHAEAFEVYYDPSVISFKDLVRVFFASIDPTTVDGQRPDFGKQYRTIAFFRNDSERAIIENKIKEISSEYNKPIATQVVKFETFYKAEDYHQDFVKRNPNQGYVRAESIPRKERTLAKVKDLLKTNVSK